MGIEEIKRKIIQDAQTERERTLEEAREKASRIVEEEKRKAENVKEETIRTMETEGETEGGRIMTMQRLESRKRILQEKQQLIDAVFSQALQRICSLPDSEYEALMEDLMVRAAAGGEEVILSPRDRGRISPAFFKRVNARCSTPLTLAEETRPISGGFILRKGKIEVNESFDAKVKLLRDSMEKEVAHILFPGD